MLSFFFFQRASYSEQLRRKISSSEIDSDHKRLIKVTTQVTTYVTDTFSLNKKNFGLNNGGQESLTEMLCTANYHTSVTWVCSLIGLRHTFVCLLSG